MQKNSLFDFCTCLVTLSGTSIFSYKNILVILLFSRLLQVMITVFTVKSCYGSQLGWFDFEHQNLHYLRLGLWCWLKFSWQYPDNVKDARAR
jgi:hypothetical protein